MKLRPSGCLQTAAIAIFALVLGAFAASTWLRYRGGPGGDEETGPGDAARVDPAAVERARIRIEVQNGSGLEGAAGRMTEFLRANGFDVVDFRNAERFDHPRTFVVDRGGGPTTAREVAAVLRGVPIDAGGDRSPYLDVTVVVGRDIDEVLARGSPEREGWRRWLDELPRR